MRNKKKLSKYIDYIIAHFDTIAPILKNTYDYECSYKDTNGYKTLIIIKGEDNKTILTHKFGMSSIYLYGIDVSYLDYDKEEIKPLIHALKDITMTL